MLHYIGNFGKKNFRPRNSSFISTGNKPKHITTNKHQYYITQSNNNVFSVNCLCGGKYTDHEIAKHFETKKHIEFIKANFPSTYSINPNTTNFIKTLNKKDKLTLLKLIDEIKKFT